MGKIINIIRKVSDLRFGYGINRCHNREVYSVLTDGTCSRTEILQASTGSVRIPQVGEVPGDWVLTPVIAVDAQPVNNSIYLWDVTVQYEASWQDSSVPPSLSVNLNPLQRPPEISVSEQVSIEEIDKDCDGNPITNAAGQLFSTPASRRVTDEVVTIVRNEPSYDRKAMRKFRNTVNLNSFLDEDPGTVLCASITAGKQEYENGFMFIPVTYQFIVRDDGWKVRKLNEGTYQLVDRDGVKTLSPCLDDNGDVVTAPVRLDKDGKQIPTSDTQTHWMEFSVYPMMDFSELRL